mmetsp:Transcript_11465/g.16358  ORF Transcript_11465/g.16358 Transcript_11465/m.16358 type:complete len:156 (+) Transcript_11465:34-501(+)
MSSIGEAGAIDIGSSNTFIEGRGVKVDIEGRSISVFRHHGELYALDHHCYHAGGPLSSSGDIEDLKLKGATHPCVVCPWHKYKISLKTGEGIYKHVDPFSSRPKAVIKSRGKKQRKHEVFDTEDGRVMIAVNTAEDIKYESDYYSSEHFQLRMRN